ncbi:MAG: hypothetical protein M3R15_35355 [Acidobacteriota bacterium]|nr:hypothetical protein [Acidobacteriota bacterium]
MATLERVIEEARTLKPDELCTLRDAIDDLLAEGSESPISEEEFAQHLAAKGIIAPIAPPQADAVEDEEWEPVEFTGKPLSEMIIEERR